MNELTSVPLEGGTKNTSVSEEHCAKACSLKPTVLGVHSHCTRRVYRVHLCFIYFVGVAWWQFTEQVVSSVLSIHWNPSCLDIHSYMSKYIFATFI